MPDALDIPEPALPEVEPPLPGSRSFMLQQLRAEKFARYSLLVIVLLAAVVVFNMVKAFVVPIILAAVFAGLFHPFYKWLLKVARGRRATAAFVCCLALSLGVLLPAYGIANLVAREAVRLYQAAEGKGLRSMEADFHSFVQRHPTLQSLRLESLSLHATMQPVVKKATDLLATAINHASRETFEFVANLFLTFFTMFYFFRDGPLLVQRLKYFSPLADRHEDELIRRFLTVSRATLKTTLLVALIKGTIGGATFWVLGLEAPVLWGGGHGVSLRAASGRGMAGDVPGCGRPRFGWSGLGRTRDVSHRHRGCQHHRQCLGTDPGGS